MATLVLTAVGGVLGPLGAAIGAAAGNAIDRELLFKPKGREGPRLTELRVQTSSYGTQIPKVFGTMRVAGSVIWATDLVEHRSSQGGKGRPTTTSYSYTASFAVALSGRPVLGVGRIWADGKLLRGAAGDFKTRTTFRLHSGGEGQLADPLIASAEGAALAPAHRGIAYAVFEDLELADFGNRIPSLSFEVIADNGPVAAIAVAAQLADGVLSGEGGPALTGFAAQGSSLRAAVEMLSGAAGGWVRSDGDRLTLLAGPSDAIAIDDARISARGASRTERAIASALSVPARVSLSHYDPARDHQAGVQHAVRPGAGTRELRLELAAALGAGEAKAIAETTLARMEGERERRTVTLPWRALAVRPGERVTIDAAPGVWRVDRWSFENMILSLECVPVVAASLPRPATPGRMLPAPDRLPGATILHAFELPPLGDTPATAPRLGIAAAGSAAGWRNAALLLSTDGGQSWSEAGTTALPAVIGTLIVPPGSAPATLIDRRYAVEVELAHEEMTLADADDAALATGANLALIGDELVQFARATPTGANRWRLSGLWRGRRGTEAAAGRQAAGDRFVLVRREALTVLDLPASTLGGTVRLLAQGAGDSGTAEAVAAITGISVLPPPPAQLAFAPAAEGGGEVRWVRRSRTGWDWLDGVDAPLGEEREAYRVSIRSGAARRDVDTDVARVTLTPGECAAGATIEVRQLGARGLSPAALLTLPQNGEST